MNESIEKSTYFYIFFKIITIFIFQQKNNKTKKISKSQYERCYLKPLQRHTRSSQDGTSVHFNPPSILQAYGNDR